MVITTTQVLLHTRGVDPEQQTVHQVCRKRHGILHAAIRRDGRNNHTFVEYRIPFHTLELTRPVQP